MGRNIYSCYAVKKLSTINGKTGRAKIVEEPYTYVNMEKILTYRVCTE